MMKISLQEIWNFETIGTSSQWEFVLRAGGFSGSPVDWATLTQIKTGKDYDTEILPGIFTFREILWQPDVFQEAEQSLPALRILHAHSQELAQQLQSGPEVNQLYASLVEYLGEACLKSGQRIEEKPGNPITRILGDFRTEVFPVIKFFIFHPGNRRDYYLDALNRLNYAVKVMLTQFHGRYTELHDPYWEVKPKKNTVTSRDSGSEKNSTEDK